MASAGTIGGTTTVGVIRCSWSAQERLDLEPRQRDQRRARSSARAGEHDQADRVEERRDREHAVRVADQIAAALLHQVGEEGAVGELHALGPPGRAAGVRQQREVAAGSMVPSGGVAPCVSRSPKPRVPACGLVEQDESIAPPACWSPPGRWAGTPCR